MFSQTLEDQRFFGCNNYGYFSIRHDSSDKVLIEMYFARKFGIHRLGCQPKAL